MSRACGSIVAKTPDNVEISRAQITYGNQWQSVAISGNQWQAIVISLNQVVIKTTADDGTQR